MQQNRFGRVPCGLVELMIGNGLSYREVAFVTVLFQFAGDKEVCWPAQTEICKRMGLKVKPTSAHVTVSRMTKAAERVGLKISGGKGGNVITYDLKAIRERALALYSERQQEKEAMPIDKEPEVTPEPVPAVPKEEIVSREEAMSLLPKAEREKREAAFKERQQQEERQRRSDEEQKARKADAIRRYREGELVVLELASLTREDHEAHLKAKAGREAKLLSQRDALFQECITRFGEEQMRFILEDSYDRYAGQPDFTAAIGLDPAKAQEKRWEAIEFQITSLKAILSEGQEAAA